MMDEMLNKRLSATKDTIERSIAELENTVKRKEAIETVNSEMRPQRSTSKRRRRKLPLVATLASILLLLPGGSQTRPRMVVDAFQGRWIPWSRGMHRRERRGGPCFNAPPCPRRVPFHRPLFQSTELGQCSSPSLGLVRLWSTEVDIAESPGPSTQVDKAEVTVENVVAPAQNATAEATVNGKSSDPAPQNSSSGISNATLLTTVPASNGKENSVTVNGASVIDESNIPIWETEQPTDDDVPHPTANGGYTHTKSSKAKISAANKGKIPWNKGKARSEETRARIAAGVRARNRQNFLKKLEEQGITEEEYKEQKRAERRKKDAERRARRTEKGGLRPTKETKEKISKVLKDKYAKGEIKRTPVDPSKVRRGFTHSAETRAKISASLKKRWANDKSYRDNMVEKSNVSNSAEDVRKRISETLKAKWQDPEFREKMMAKIHTRKSPEKGYGKTHRQRISEAMKKKWQDQEYRNKIVNAMAKKREEMGILPSPRRTRRKKTDEVRAVQPRAVKKVKKVVAVKKKKVAKPAIKKTTTARKAKPKKTAAKKKKKTKGAKKTEPDGSISRLREERRDLYDLLYADEDDAISPSAIPFAAVLEDEDLDDFDPYGLEDF